MRPVFVVGCQRSGSTLLGAMLGGHSEIICVPEGQFIVDLMPDAEGRRDVDPAAVIEQVVRHWRFRVWEFEVGAERPDPRAVGRSYRGAIEWLVRRYAAAHGRAGAKIWVDQQPGHVRFLWRLFQHFPDARAIHIIRDGRAVAASIMPLDWGPNEIYSAAQFWKLNVGLGYAASAFLRPDQLLHVRYEDLVADSEATMRRLAKFVGVEFEPSMLATTGLRLPNFTKHQHGLIGSPPAAKRINAWQDKLTRRQIAIFERLCCDLLRQHGYRHLSDFHTPRMRWAEKGLLIARDQVKKAIREVRFRLRRRPHAW